MSQFNLLQSRNFLPLFICQFLGALNDNIFRFALVIFITFKLAGASSVPAGTLVALSGGVFILPFLLFSAVAGQLADKYEKSRLIRRVKFAEIIVMGLGALAFWSQRTEFLFCVLFLTGVQAAFFGPLKYSILPQHLRATEMIGGNGLIQMATYIAILTGAAAGGLIASITGYGPLPVIVTVLVVALLGWGTACLIPEAVASAPGLAIDWHVPRATWRLLRHTLATRETTVLLLMISWFWFIGAAFLSVVPSYGRDLLHADARAVTLLNAAFTVGIGVGSLLCEGLSRRRIELGLVPLAGFGISLFAADVWRLGLPEPAAGLTLGTFFAAPAALRIFIDLVGIGAFGALFIVPLNAALQARAAAAERARVIGSLNILNALLMVASALFTALLFQLGCAIPTIFLCVAVLHLVVLIAGWRALPEFGQRVRRLLRRA
ncbi:MAG: MFS transporter [Gammaproteobacteria bacterium]|nr:MFS transporter [Gammaproteobacteria bacterium]